jgi:hypothetical protein
MLNKMIKPVYESAVSALYIDPPQFGSTADRSQLQAVVRLAPGLWNKDERARTKEQG